MGHSILYHPSNAKDSSSENDNELDLDHLLWSTVKFNVHYTLIEIEFLLAYIMLCFGNSNHFH